MDKRDVSDFGVFAARAATLTYKEHAGNEGILPSSRAGRPRSRLFSIHLTMLASFACLTPTGSVLAQGQDSTPTERNALVMAELLSRVYDNYNQVYFDRRIGINLYWMMSYCYMQSNTTVRPFM